MKCFVVIVNGFQLGCRSILDVAAVLDPPLTTKHLSLGFSKTDHRNYFCKRYFSIFLGQLFMFILEMLNDFNI